MIKKIDIPVLTEALLKFGGFDILDDLSGSITITDEDHPEGAYEVDFWGISEPVNCEHKTLKQIISETE